MTPGARSETGPIRSILLKHPREAWLGRENIRDQWKALGYTEEPDLAKAVAEYDRFVDILRGIVTDVRFLPADARTGLD